MPVVLKAFALCKKIFSLSHTYLVSEEQRETAAESGDEKRHRGSRSGGHFTILCSKGPIAAAAVV